MAQTPEPPGGRIPDMKGRRRFLARVLAPAALVATVAPIAAALGPALARAAEKRSRRRTQPSTAGKSAPAGNDSPFAAALPDVTVARTPEERAALEKQWKGMVEIVETIRKAEVSPATAPALAFAALPRQRRERAGKSGRRSR